MKALMIGGDFWHSAGQYYCALQVSVCETLDFAASIEAVRSIDLHGYDILYITRSFYNADSLGKLTQKSIADDDERRIQNFVETGGALFLMHAGVTIRSENAILADVARGMFIMHPPACPFTLAFDDTDDAIARQAAYEVNDELYHVTTDASTTRVFAWAHSKQYGTHIAGWAHSYKRGKVAVFTPGHAHDVIASDAYQTTIKHVSQWLIRS